MSVIAEGHRLDLSPSMELTLPLDRRYLRFWAKMEIRNTRLLINGLFAP